MNLKNIGWPIMLASSVLVLFLTYTGNLPQNLIGAYGLMFILGIVFGEIGTRIKFIDNWLGGGAILCIFGPAVMLYFGLLPESTVGLMDDFMNNTPAFFYFFISTMIAGALFSISQKILIQSTIRFLPTIIGALVVSWALCYVGGVLTGFGGVRAIMMLGIPVMGGGVGAGALPLSQIYADATGAGGVSARDILSIIMPAVIIGNVLSIIFGGLMHRVGLRYPKMTGNGQIMRVADTELLESLNKEKNEREGAPITIQNLGLGLFTCTMFFLVAHACATFIPVNLHTFVWLILLLTLAKAVKLFPERVELCTIQWSNTLVRNLVYPALIPIGITFISVPDVLNAISDPSYLIITLLAVVGAVIGAGIVGKFMGLYLIEACLAGGLCMSNMAQTGDLAVLAAAKRLELLPYAAYSSRIGGSIVLVLAGLLVASLGLGG